MNTLSVSIHWNRGAWLAFRKENTMNIHSLDSRGRKKIYDVDVLRSLFEYDPETGHLIWKHRTMNSFDVEDDILAAVAKTWNSRWPGKRAGRVCALGYREIKINNNIYFEHRLIWQIVTGKSPDYDIDHVNGDRADNRWENIRAATPKDNRRNLSISKNNTSGVMGVRWSSSRSKWEAQIKVERKSIFLGRFHTLNEAREARRSAELRYGFHPNHGMR